MLFRSLLTVSILLLTVSCSEIFRTEQDDAALTQTTAVPTPSIWFLFGGDLGRPYAWISGPAGKYPVFNYSIKAQPIPGPGIRTLGDTADLTIELPRPLTGQNVTLEFPEVIYPFHPVRQPKITCRILVNGSPVKQLTASMPPAGKKPPQKTSLRLDIPSGLTNGHSLKIRFEYAKLKTAAELGGKGNHKPGIGFITLKPVPNRPGRAYFLVRESSPVKGGRQQVELELLQPLGGPKLPDRVSLEVRIAPYDRQSGFRPDDLLDLALQQEKDRWSILYGGLSAVTNVGYLPSSLQPAFYYPPKKLPKTNPPLPGPAVAAQKSQIMSDLQSIRGRVKEYRRDAAREERLQRLWLQRQKEYPLIPKVISPETGQEIERYQNRYRWGKCQNAFFALAKDYEFKRPAGIIHNIGALNELHRLLQSCNIQLIVMMIPDPECIAASALMSGGRLSEDPAALQCAATLLEYGIETVYADPAVLTSARVADRLFLYPSPVPDAELWAVLADLAAKRLSRFGDKEAFSENPPAHYRQIRNKTVFGDNCRWPEGVDCGEHKSGETAESLAVLRDGIPFEPDPASKILVIGGDMLNLPGPGHTFSGLLSMRLRYPVDELVPAGGVWLHNLPLVLLGDPVRWLAGKQVCLLMVSPRMLENDILPNLRTESELFAKLRRGKPVHRYKLPPKKTEIVLPAPDPKERRFVEKTRWNRFWSQFTGTPLMIEEDGRPQSAGEFAVPEKLTRSPFIFFAEIMGYPEQSVTMIVNGRKVPLLVESRIPYWSRPAAVELPAGTTSIKLEFSGRRGDLVRIRAIQLYQ
ncbi:MAG: hypothetical protein IJS14_12200 [Lentisphaeria bacterium]|nr:hypothetical protein [Lentisphaeria bacterium]